MLQKVQMFNTSGNPVPGSDGSVALSQGIDGPDAFGLEHGLHLLGRGRRRKVEVGGHFPEQEVPDGAAREAQGKPVLVEHAAEAGELGVRGEEGDKVWRRRQGRGRRRGHHRPRKGSEGDERWEEESASDGKHERPLLHSSRPVTFVGRGRNGGIQWTRADVT
jgi:hypothetical protein